MTTTLQQPARDTVRVASSAQRTFGGLVTAAAAAIGLQAVWAGLFLEHDGARDAAGIWVAVHARGAEVALFLAGVAAGLAFLRLRTRRDLWVGASGLATLLVVESYLGGLVSDDGDDVLTVVHVPLAMAVMALSVWLCLRSRRPHAARATRAGPR